MINSEGDKIRMEVHDLIPYVYLGAKDYRPVPDHEAELVMKVLGLMGDSTASRTIYLDGESGDEMSESDDGVGDYVDGQRNLRAGPRRRRNDLDERQFLQQLVKNMTKMTAMNHPSAKRIRTRKMFTLTTSLVGMRMEKMTMMIEYQQLMISQRMINLMKMKLVLKMDHMKKKMMRMISMFMIPMGEYDCQREVP